MNNGKNPPLISIALCTFNGERYLNDQLKSYASQSILPDELIICDDGSSDGTVSIAKEFATQANFSVRVFQNKRNIGYTKNFSECLAKCSGKYVFLSDQDDQWKSHKIETMVNYLEANPEATLIIHDLDYCKSDLTPIGQTKIERMENICDLNSDYVTGMATCIRKTFLEKCLPVPFEVDGLTHDLWLHKCSESIGGKAILREILANYRRHSSNATQGKILNVDYITTAKYFRKPYRSYLDQKDHENYLLSIISEPLLPWLQENREALIEDGFSSRKRIDQKIQNLSERQEIAGARLKIINENHLARVPEIANLYFQGGYHVFSGWKSAVKDLLV